MVNLASVRNQRLYIDCHCGHTGYWVIADLLALLNPPKTLQDVKERSRCSSCLARSVKGVSFSTAHGSDNALAATGFGHEDAVQVEFE